jgi:predicted permease
VLAFTASVAIAVALLLGVVPALRASRTEPIEAIREHGRGTAGERGIGVGGALVAGQVALSLVLVVAAGLFIRTFTTLATLNVGFDRDPVLLVRLDPPTSAEPLQRAALYERVAVTVRATPGVAHAAISEVTPVSGMITDVYVEIENGPQLAPPQNISYRNVITPDWLATYGTRLAAGRDFNDRDRLASPPVAIVNETFARRFLQRGNPLGWRIRNPSSAPGETGPWMEVVGIAADATYLSLRDAVPPTMYVPLAQQPAGPGFFPFATLSVREAANGPPALLARRVGDAIARVDPRIAITFTPLQQQVEAALVQERMMAMLSGSFGALALLLSALGLYGVTAYAVNRQRTEIGIRMAIGAAPACVVRLVLARVTILVGIGVLIGAGTSIWAAKLVSALLYGVEPRDPVTLSGAALMLAIVAALAGWLPAWRATRIDPAEVLRES